ncbi:oligosaccharide flippase family protein [Methylobacterium sp.]|uniref:oligosaccharide flippase family protein n=1 Tax=Methylobacterium sp. TaxID=409 RepID=UPI003AFFCE57
MTRSNEAQIKHRSVTESAARGLVWLVGQTFASRLVQAATQILLARILSPPEFGLIGLTFAITAVIGVLFSFGFDDVILQRGRNILLWLRTAFCLSFIVGFFGFCAMVAAAPIGAYLFNQPNITGLVIVASLSVPIMSVGTILNAVLRARLQFNILASASFLEILITSALSLCFAGLGFGAYSFVLPLPIVALLRVIALAVFVKPKLKRKITVLRLKILIPAASASLGARLLVTLISQADTAILGLFSSKASVGLYYFAFRIAVQPLRAIASSYSNVLFPALTQFRNDPQRQLRAAINSAMMVSAFIMPLCVYQASISGSMIRLLFKPEWWPSTVIVQILSLGLAFDACSWSAGSLMVARGQFRRNFMFSALGAPIIIVLILLGAALYSSVGVACAVFAYYFMAGPFICFLVIFRGQGSAINNLFRLYAAPFLLSSLSAFAAWFPIHQIDDEVLYLVLFSITYFCLYSVLFWYLMPATRDQLLIKFRAVMPQRFFSH